MSIGALSATSANAATNVQPQRKKELTQEDFLNLMLTQMRYQNPLSPMDNYQMAAQLTQMGTMEGINKLTEAMDVMSAYQASTAHLQVAGLLGKKVEALGNHLVIDQEKVSEGSYQLSTPGKVTLEIYDGKGNRVRTIEEGSKEATKQKFTWDGRNELGVKLPDGVYTFSVRAVDAKGGPIPVSTSVIGTVTGVSFEDGVTSVTVGSDRIPLASIFAILS